MNFPPIGAGHRLPPIIGCCQSLAVHPKGLKARDMIAQGSLSRRSLWRRRKRVGERRPGLPSEKGQSPVGATHGHATRITNSNCQRTATSRDRGTRNHSTGSRFCKQNTLVTKHHYASQLPPHKFLRSFLNVFKPLTAVNEPIPCLRKHSRKMPKTYKSKRCLISSSALNQSSISWPGTRPRAS
jgi:hypothetical protein